MRENEFMIITEIVQDAADDLVTYLLDRIALSVKRDSESILVFLDTGALAVDKENGKAILSRKERDAIIGEILSNKQLFESCFMSFEEWLNKRFSASEALETDVDHLHDMFFDNLKEHLYKRFIPYKFNLDDVI